jgi:serine protease Do
MGLYIRDLDQRDVQALHLPHEQRGVVVSGVDDEGPAAAVGIEPGDVITALDGRRVDTRADFVRLLGTRRAGERVRLEILRQTNSRQVAFTLQARPRVMRGSEPIAPGQPATRQTMAPVTVWLAVANLEDTNLAQYFDVQAGSGVLVLGLGGIALDRLQAGDVIIDCASSPVRSVRELQERWSTTQEDEDLVLRIVRRGRTRTVRLGPAAVAARLLTPEAPVPLPGDGKAQDWERLLREIDALRTRLRALEDEVEQQVHR